MKAKEFKFPASQESDAMLMARACGQVFCRSCSQKNTTLPKFGIEKEVRVCDSCYQEHTKPTSVKTSLEKGSDFPSAYLKSSSKADDKKKEKMRPTSKASTPEMRPLQRSPEEYTKLSHYPNRSYRKTHQSNTTDTNATRRNSSVLSSASVAHQIPSIKFKKNGLNDISMDEFVNTLPSQIEIFINLMKSSSSRGRSIVSDSSIQTLFRNLASIYSQLLKYIQQHDNSRLHYERLQYKLAQVKGTRAALDALREERRLKLKREAEEAELQRQLQMAHLLEIMRKKKQESLQYQRLLAPQRIEEQEREMQTEQEEQKHQYSLFLPNATAQPLKHNSFQNKQERDIVTQSQQIPPPVSTPCKTLPVRLINQQKLELMRKKKQEFLKKQQELSSLGNQEQ